MAARPDGGRLEDSGPSADLKEVTTRYISKNFKEFWHINDFRRCGNRH